MSMFALTNANLITCQEDASVKAGGTVVVDGEYITDVIDGALNVNVDRTIDCQGGWLLPGLIDAHVHIAALDIALAQIPYRYETSLLAIKMAHRAKMMLDCGFTTVRDAGGADIGLKRAQEQGLMTGPRMIIADRAISQTAGHGDHRSTADPEQEAWQGDIGMVNVIVDGADEVRKAVRERIRRGADVIKVYASGGAMAPSEWIYSTQFSFAELEAAVETAEANGQSVMAHALSSRAIENAVRAGARTIEHGNFLDESTAKLMAEAGTYLVPTMMLYEHARENLESYHLSAEKAAKVELAAAGSREALRHAYDNGVRIGSGSDLLGPPAREMAREIALQAEIMGTHDAILAATRANAEICGLGDKLGTLEPGKLADMILLNQDPTVSPEVLAEPSNITAIMQDGVFHKNETGH